MKTIYCDEAGFTGSNLLDDSQPYFVYSASNIEADKNTNDFVNDLKKQFRIQMPELKGAKLLKNSPGKNAILKIWEEYGKDTKCIIVEKKYALTGHLFEYVFEPSLTSNNKYFYEIKFHLFIAYTIYDAMINKKDGVHSLMEKFHSIFRTDDRTNLFNSIELASFSDKNLSNIFKFILLNKGILFKELLDNDKIPKWVLDQTFTSLYSLLCSWGEETNDSLNVFCDQSKPLLHNKHVFENFKNLSSKPSTVKLWETDHPVTFKLENSIQFCDSAQTIELQIADIISSSLNYALNNRDDAFSKKILKKATSSVFSERSIMPSKLHRDEINNSLPLHQYILERLCHHRQENTEILDKIMTDLKKLI